MTKDLTTTHTAIEHGTSVAHFMPNGLLWSGKYNEQNELKKMLNGFGSECARGELALVELFTQRDINLTEQLISEWESAVGIPDDCFTTDKSLEVRRGQVIIKLAYSPQIIIEFEELARLLGYNDVIVRNLGSNRFPRYNVPFCPATGTECLFTVEVIGTGVTPRNPPYDVPFPLFSDSTLIQCVFDKFKPANVLFVYIERI